MKGSLTYRLTEDFKEVRPFQYQASRERVVIDNPVGTYWILAEDNGNIVGICGCFIRGKTARVKSVWVNPTYRRRGIFAQLLDLTMQSIRKCDATVATCFATEMSRPGFAKAGFVAQREKNGITFMRLELQTAEVKV